MNEIKVPKCFEVTKLTLLEAWTALADRMNNVTFDSSWDVYQVGAELLGFVKNHKKDWFNDNDNIKGVI